MKMNIYAIIYFFMTQSLLLWLLLRPLYQKLVITILYCTIVCLRVLWGIIQTEKITRIVWKISVKSSQQAM